MEERKGTMQADGRVSYGEEGMSDFVKDNPRYTINPEVLALMAPDDADPEDFEEFGVVMISGGDTYVVALDEAPAPADEE